MSHIPSAERLIRQRGDALVRRLGSARRGDVGGIHQARVATRRLREALPLLPSNGPRRRIGEAVRKLTQALGPVRELDVSLEGLRELERTHPQWQAALACAREMMIDDRRAALAFAIRRIDKWDPSRLRKAARRAGKATVQAGAARESRTDRLALLRRRAARRAERLRNAIEHAAGVYLPDRLHVVRIAVKKLRYVLETYQQMTERPSARRAARTPSARSTTGQIAVLRQVQDLLGRLHDQEMLTLRLRAAQGALEEPHVGCAGDLEAAIRVLETECRRLHGQYVTLRPRVLGVAARIVAAAQSRAPAA
jgi:CHAD domain-containing protein